MSITKNNQHIFYGLSLAAATTLLVVLGYEMSPKGSFAETIFFALGGKMPDGLIQAATFACFYIALFGLKSIQGRIQWEQRALGARLLPEIEQFVLYPEDVSQIKLDTIEAERRIGAGLLTDLIKQAATKFRANQSSSDALSMVETVSEMQRKAWEKDLWLLHTCQTLIPAFGFLGTVLGMAAAILNMGKSPSMAAAGPATESAPAAAASITTADIQSLTDSLGTAFFTTIVSIVLGIVVSILMKQQESQIEALHTGMKRYVVENLVNRIHL